MITCIYVVALDSKVTALEALGGAVQTVCPEFTGLLVRISWMRGALGPKLGIPLIAQGKDVAKPKSKTSSHLLHLDRDQVALMREELARLVEENATLRKRCEVDIPHWAGQVWAVASDLEEAAEPIVTVPLGARLLGLVERLQEAAQGLRALRGAPYREVS